MIGTVEGTAAGDVIDTTYAGDPEGETVNGAANVVLAGDGRDTVLAGGGDDTVHGGADDDRLYGGAGNDTMFGEAGKDILWGEEGDDVLDGGDGDDTVKGGVGNDVLTGGAGNDWLGGGADRDTLIAGAGDYADGGSEGDDYDVLDLTGIGRYRIENLTRDLNGNGWNGVVVLLDDNGDPTGETIRFDEIEGFVEPPHGGPDGTVEGTGGDDLIDGGYTGDPEGDMVDNNDALLPGAVGNDDLIYGFAGNDEIHAGNGDDSVFGGSGNDLMYGGTGNDTIYGNTGDDTSYGGSGNDSFQDSIGHDTVFGGSGDDIIRLSDDGSSIGQDDSVLGGTGRDTVYGGSGNDRIDSSDGGIGWFDNPYPPLPADADPLNDMDTVYGGNGDDWIRTGDDADLVSGGQGNDYIDAGIDNDTLFGDQGNDTLIGGEGSDTIHGGSGDDLIYGGLPPSFPDELNIPDVDGDLVTNNGMDVIYAGSGNDTVHGMDDDDTIYGGQGDDYLDGGIDDDVVYGDQGNDVLTGGQGNDSLYGGNDRDLFVGGNGGDHVDGGSGGDDWDTLDLTGTGVDHIEYTSADREDGIVHFLDGTTMTFEEIENVIPCFTPGTAIATPRGERLVEELQVGDRIITRDNGIQEIRWIGHKEMSGKALVNAPHLKPILIKAGALGNGLPERDMLVSPNHRVLVSNDRTQLYFEESEVLAAAKHLVGAPGIHALDVMSTTYIHFMFDRHEVVLSNGAWTESFQPGDYSLKGIGNAQRTEIFELFPELKTRDGIDGYQAARKALKKHEARLLVR